MMTWISLHILEAKTMLVTSSTVIHAGWYSSLLVDVSNKKPDMR